MSNPSRPRYKVERDFTFLVSFADSMEELDKAYGCQDFPTFQEAEKFIRETFFNNPSLHAKAVYIISTYNPRLDIVLADICKCYWRHNMLHELSY